ncbi:MAG: creatininase family protein [Chloroflexi bacterium]|nr:creatininase family protein [Chloroflexota bacterium]
MAHSTFRYDHLTWPEVAALPRQTPLALPLGPAPAAADLHTAFAADDPIGVLPSIPYGWAGSGLETSPELLSRMVSNLLAGLQEDGFTRVAAIVPPGFTLNLGSREINLSPATPLPALDLPEHGDGRVLLIPIGHTEQHGYHLALNVDTVIIDAIARGAAKAAPAEAIALPPMPYGVSTHRRSFAATLNCGGRAFEDFWGGILDTLVGRGYDRFYFISGHGGNCSFLTTVVKYAGERHPHIFAATTWLYLNGPAGVAALEELRQSKIGGMGHAGELETSLMLHLAPDLTWMDRVVDETEFIATPAYYMDWVEGGALVANPPWEDDTATGSYGAGSLGTAEKGRLWLAAAIEEKIDHVRQIHDQQNRRMAKRAQQNLPQI